MRPIALILALCATMAFAAEGEAGAADLKAEVRALDAKIASIRDTATKADPELTVLKTAADEAVKSYETAIEAKLQDNAEYQEAKEALGNAKKARKKANKKDKKQKEAAE